MEAPDQDLELILAKKHHLKGDFWTSPDYRIGTGSPFSARDVAILLTELELDRSDPLVQGLAETLFTNYREDGRFRVFPSGGIYPCHTITILRCLCYLGYSDDLRLQKTFTHLWDIQHDDGGWRCNKTKLGKGPLTDASNPGVTLEALDAFRFTDAPDRDKRLDRAVETLLDHWVTRIPVGPCHFGIGSRFLKVEFPFLRYNLFYYCFVLSHYQSARQDNRFQEALATLQARTEKGRLVIEAPKRGLTKLSFCKKGSDSEPANKRYQQLLENVATS